MRTFLYLFVLTAFLYSCPDENKLWQTNTFSENETQQLVEFLEKFDAKVCAIENMNSKHPQKCYKVYLDRTKETFQKTGGFYFKMDENDHDELVQSLSPELQQEIWLTGTQTLQRFIPYTYSSERFPDTIEYLALSLGKYYNFLTEEALLLDCEMLEYVHRVELLKSIESLATSHLYNTFPALNLKDERIRLIIALHILIHNKNGLNYSASCNELYSEIAELFEERRKSKD